MGHCCDNCTDQNLESMFMRNKVQILIGSLVLIAVYLSYKILRCQSSRRGNLFPVGERCQNIKVVLIVVFKILNSFKPCCIWVTGAMI